MGKFVVIVLDGFGMGAMADAHTARPGDERACTIGSILKDYPEMKLVTLEKLGLMNAYGQESECMKFAPNANWGKSNLMHYGADTFMGHQEIMGTLPRKPLEEPFQMRVDEIEKHLKECGHKVQQRVCEGLRYLVVDDYVTVADNLEADLGMVYNVTAPLDYISFEKELEIGHKVRAVAKVNRVIVFGGRGNNMQDLYNAQEVREHKYIGIESTKSKSYEHDYHCIHMGYGVDKTVQAPTILTAAGIPVSLFGKVADIVANDGGKSVSWVDTGEVLDKTLEEIKNMDSGFICTNVQETDLSGHSQDSGRYKEVLEIADEHIAKILPELEKDDILLVMADHGNDPDIGHSKHTREMVPLLVYKQGLSRVRLGVRDTLSDVGASVCDYFGVKAPENGTSFLSLLR